MACTLKINGVEIDQQTLAAIATSLGNDPNFKNAVAYENYIRLTKDEQEVRPTVLTYLKDTLGYANEQEVRDGIAAESARREAFTGKNTNPALKRFWIAIKRGKSLSKVTNLFSNRGVWGLWGVRSGISRKLADKSKERVREVNAQMFRVKTLTDAFEDRMEKLSKFLTDADRIAITNVLNGASWDTVSFEKIANDPKKIEAVIKQLDPAIKLMRNSIDELTKRMISTPNLLTPLQAKIFTDNLGKYTTILYEAHRNPDFATYFKAKEITKDGVVKLEGGKYYEDIYNAAKTPVKAYLKFESDAIGKLITRKNKAIASLIAKQKGLTGNDLLANQSNVKKLENDVKYLQTRFDNIKDALSDPEKFNNEVVNTLQYMQKGDSLTNATTPSGARGAINKDIFRKRKNIPQEIRDLFGQIKDPVLVYQTTIAKMLNTVVNAEYQNTLADINEQILKGGNKTIPPIFSTKPIPEKGVTFKIKLADSFSVLAERLGTKEVYVAEQVADFFQENEPSQGTAGFLSLLSTFNIIAKLNATVFSVPTQERNLIANLGKLLTVAITQRNGLKAITKFFSSAKRRFKNEAGEAGRVFRIRKGQLPAENFEERFQFVLHQQGVKSSDFTVEEVKQEINNNKLISVYEDFINRTKTGEILNEAIKYPFKSLTRAYAASDDIVKEAIFYVEAETYSEIYFGKGYEELVKTGNPEEIKKVEDIAGVIVRRSLPNYNNAWELTKFLQKFGGGFIAPFAAFRLEQARTLIGMAGVIGDEIMNEEQDPEIRSKIKWVGIRRAIGFAMLIGISSQYVMKLISSMGGLDDEERDDVLKWYVPDFVENPIIEIDENGFYSVIDNSSVNLYGSVGLFDRYIADLMSSDPDMRDSAIFDMLKKIIQPLIEPQLGASSAFAAFSGKDQYGKDLFSPNDDSYTKVKKFLEAFFKVPLVPGTAKALIRYQEKKTELERKEQDYYDLEKSGKGSKEQLDLLWDDLQTFRVEVEREWVATGFGAKGIVPGVREYTINPNSQIPKKIYDLREKMGNNSTDYKDRVNELGGDEIVTNDQRKEIYQELVKGYQNDLLKVKDWYDTMTGYGFKLENLLTISPPPKGEKDPEKKKGFFSKKELDFIMGKEKKIPELTIELYNAKVGEEK
jgi:hypothetical protein